jgi:hypothetical protein
MGGNIWGVYRYIYNNEKKKKLRELLVDSENIPTARAGMQYYKFFSFCHDRGRVLR